MPLPTLITDLSTTAASNYPTGSDSPSVLDDVQRAHAAFIAQLRDGTGFTDGLFAAAGANTNITSLSGVTSINGGQFAGMRNNVINGDFSINQRVVSGTVTLAAGAYGHDRFKAGASGCTYTFATALNVTTITISAGSLIQVVDGIYLRSGTYCLSWGGTAQGKIGAGAYGASGITGTAVGGTNLNIEFGTGTLRFVQLEFGTIPSYFESRLNELQLCWRYYQTRGVDYRLYGAAGIVYYVPFSIQPMRASPTISSTFSYSNASAGVVSADASGRAYIQATVTALGTAEASASVATFSAEL